ncbi:pre-peptidase C-terminal domain-containing protein [Pseudoalteromonas byunsanensis]|uniref:Phosphohydrolase n=1 Tax=Pseudoalteromonas byunsanensis TaxID=327939 RepID=A0A1S1N599_9GAMM|nr:pre-peptidase C-terminal domain-containing protein [Pseudoalteromonas byunsanensis]OHU94835.1 phosphohydrolase [Pseudoalteromonas byunsanensis]
MSTRIVSLAIGLTLTASAQAGSQYHRLIWDHSPKSQATIGFTPSGGSNHHVKYGTSTDEQNWTVQPVSASRTFDGSLESQFVTLKNLSANTNIYYRVCDTQGCSEAFWFKTAPADNQAFTAIAGGDTRTGWTTRRQGNQLIAKIRPLFIMHGGDYTNANSVSEMKEYLQDWQLTFSDDIIDGINYRRIYPFVATHGNHEDDNYRTLCQVFGVDYNQDGECTSSDTYGAFNVGTLLRVYTLNSQYKNSGWSSYASAMNDWLAQDLSSQGSTAKWRSTQYHKPMYPHYSGKSDNTILHTWWADAFYNHAMNLVVESDTHINKLTQALQPTNNGFNATTSGGTVYVGEGSWGAPARSANDPKSWTIDLASIQQFKVLSVSSESLLVRTAQFDASADTLTRAQRAADPLALPTNVNWWHANEIGEVLTLKQATNKLSVIDNGTGPVEPPKAIALQNGEALTGLSAAKDNETHYVLDVPDNVTSLSFNTSGGSGDADMYVKFAQLATQQDYDCRPYENGNTENCTISSIQSGKYYVMLHAYQAYSDLSLVANFSVGTTPGSQQQWPDQSASKEEWLYYTFEVPAGTSSLKVQTTGGSGDADLYVRFAQQPTTSSYECRPYENDNEELCSITNPQPGVWHLGLRAYRSFSGVLLSAQTQ